MSDNDKKNKKPKAIDVDQVDMDLLREKSADLPALLEYAHSVGGFQIVPTQEGIIKGRAQNAMFEQSQMQLDQIKDQMRLLAEQAKSITDRVKISEKIYQAKMTFEPLIGHTYFLYHREQEENYFLSMIGPKEWGKSKKKPHFVAKVTLLSDHTWKIDESQLEEQESAKERKG